MAHRPVGLGSSFSFSAGTATTSVAFSVQSSVLRVVSVGGDSFISVGGNPSATVNNYYIPTGGTATLALTKASNRVVGILTGTTTVITVPEGTQVPFSVGDYVSLSVGGQSYYDFVHKQVLSVDTSSGVNGYHQTKMTVDHNSVGVTTAFSPQDASVVISNKVSAFGVGSGTLYYQQVQISGQA